MTWQETKSVIPGFAFAPGTPYAPAQLSPFHRAERHYANTIKRRAKPSLTVESWTDVDVGGRFRSPPPGRPASRADLVRRGSDWRQPSFLRQFLSPEGLLLRRKEFPYVPKKVYRSITRNVKTARAMGMMDIFSKRVGGGAGGVSQTGEP